MESVDKLLIERDIEAVTTRLGLWNGFRLSTYVTLKANRSFAFCYDSGPS